MLSKRLAGLVLSLGCAFGFAVTANEAADIDCLERAHTLKAINKCLRHSSAIQARNLDTLMRELAATLPTERFDALSDLQAAWVVQMVRGCQWERTFFTDRSVARSVLKQCVGALIEGRTDRLKILLCDGAGATGPCEASSRY